MILQISNISDFFSIFSHVPKLFTIEKNIVKLIFSKNLDLIFWFYRSEINYNFIKYSDRIIFFQARNGHGRWARFADPRPSYASAGGPNENSQ